MLIISYTLFLFLLIFSPLAFGTVEAWSHTVMETCTAVSFLFLVIYYFLPNKNTLKIPGIFPLFLLLGYMFLQLVPLPVPLVKIISPATFELYRPLLEIEPEIRLISLSVNRKSTLLQFFTFTAYALVYLLTIYHCSRAERFKKTIAIVICLGVLIAVEAILQKLTLPDLIYWFRTTPNSSPLGPWVYKNHFAGFMEMLFPLTIGLFLFYRPQIAYERSLREKFISIMSMTGANRHLLLGTGAILMAVSILLSVSRGGIITMGIAFLFFTLFSAGSYGDLRTRWAMILTVLIVLMISWLGWQPIIDKFGRLWTEEGLNIGSRLPVYMDSFQIFSSYPFFGTGFGTFLDAYPSVRSVPRELVFDHAHNDYIEMLVTGGLTGFLLCTWFVLSVFIHAIKKIFDRRERYSILIASGALTGMVALLLHGFVDFQIYNGANGLYFFFLCGVAVSAANTRLQYRSSPTLLVTGNKLSLAIPALAALIIMICSPMYFLKRQEAEKKREQVSSIYLNRHIPVARLINLHSTLLDGFHQDPLEAEYPYLLGQISTFLGKKSQAQHEYLQACMLKPFTAKYIQQLGMSLVTDNIEKQKKLLSLGLLREPLVLDGYLAYSDWLLRNNFRQEALDVLNRAMNKIPWQITHIANFMLPYRFTPSEIKQALPPLSAIWHIIGAKMQGYGMNEEAEVFFTRALELLDGQDVKPYYFSRLYQLYRSQKKDDKALEILRMGIEYLPDHVPFRIQQGDYYLRQGIPYRAKEEYLQALRLDPENRGVQLKLDKMRGN